MDFSYSPKVEMLRERTQAFFDRIIAPNEARVEEVIARTGAAASRGRRSRLFEELKAEARAQGLWNLFLPRSERAPQGLSNLEYAPLCEIMGRVRVGAGSLQLLGARYRQHGSARALRQRSAEGSTGSSRCWPARSVRPS